MSAATIPSILACQAGAFMTVQGLFETLRLAALLLRISGVRRYGLAELRPEFHSVV